MGLVLDNSVSPITLGEVKRHLRCEQDDNAHDTYIQSLIEAATRFVEDETGQQLGLTKGTLSLDGWPCDRVLVLPKPPLSEVLAVRYLDTSGTDQILSPAAYTVDTSSKPGRIVLRPGHSWPATERSANCVRIEFNCGYADPSKVPSNLRQVVLLQCGHWFENRESVAMGTIATEVPLTLRSILAMNSFPELVG